MCLSKFLIFVASELLGAKTKESKKKLNSKLYIYIYIYIYIYNEKSLHMLKMYGLKKM